MSVIFKASFTTAQETKLAGIEAGAEVNVNADWNAVSGDAQILNKPTLGTMSAQNASSVAVTGGTINGATIGGTTAAAGSFSTLSASETARFNTTISVGNATPSTSGAGITFPATQSASSDANTLDDYEEGTWTPTIVGSTTAGTGTYSVQTGNYVKVGKLVTASAYVWWTAHTGTGTMLISLPFTVGGTGLQFGGVAFGFVDNITLSANNILTGFTLSTEARIIVYQTPVGGGSYAAVPLDSAGQLIFTATYVAD